MHLSEKLIERARPLPKIMTTLRIEDEEGASDKLTENIAVVERAAGRRLRRC